MRTDLGPSRAKAAATTLRADVIEGLRWLWQHELLRPLAVAVALVNLGVSAIGALLVLFAVDVLGLPAVGYGFLIGVGAAGGLLGTLIAGPVVARFGRTASMAVAAGIAGASMLTLALAPSAVVAGASLFVGFAAVSLFNVVGRSVRQAVTPTAILGRVVAGFRFVGMSTVPISAVLSGILASLLGLRAPFILGLDSAWCS
ncbi:MAG: MFS transporter [Nitriliruptorales bacterium]